MILSYADGEIECAYYICVDFNQFLQMCFLDAYIGDISAGND